MRAWKTMCLATILTLLSMTQTGWAKKLDVVASFSILADMVANVGGEHVSVTTLVSPDQDAHVFEPRPGDARKVAGADLVFINGLGFEGWMERLIKSSGYKGKVITTSKGIDRLKVGSEGHDHGQAKKQSKDGHVHNHSHNHGHGPGHTHGQSHDHGDVDPHAWHSLANAGIYVDNIAAALTQADPVNAQSYNQNAKAYGRRLAEMKAWASGEFEAVPAKQRRIITSHDAFGYLGREFNLDILTIQGLSTESEPSAGEVARLIDQIRGQGVKAIFLENVSNERMLQQIARETGASIGGTLYSDALSGPQGPAPDYLSLYRHNVEQITKALRGL
jgi:zinc/manganese transport system substrate-binding protein